MKTLFGICKNCEHIFNADFKFCPNCGQQVNEELTVKVLFNNTIKNYISFDARFFKSLIPLLFRPGYLTRQFIEGKRLLYLHPAQMYLFIAFVFFFLFSFIEREQEQNLDVGLANTFTQKKMVDSMVSDYAIKPKVEVDFSEAAANDQFILRTAKKQNNPEDKAIDFKFKGIDSLISLNAPQELIYEKMGLPKGSGTFKKRLYAQALKFYKSRERGSLLKTFYDAIPIAMFFLLPIFALILKLLYWKRGYYAHHLVFSFYYFSFLFTVFSLILIINFVFDLPDWIDWLLVLSTLVYLLVALKQYQKQSWFKSIFKVSVISFSFLLLVVPLAAIILGMFAFLSY